MCAAGRFGDAAQRPIAQQQADLGQRGPPEPAAPLAQQEPLYGSTRYRKVRDLNKCVLPRLLHECRPARRACCFVGTGGFSVLLSCPPTIAAGAPRASFSWRWTWKRANGWPSNVRPCPLSCSHPDSPAAKAWLLHLRCRTRSRVPSCSSELLLALVPRACCSPVPVRMVQSSRGAGSIQT